MSMMEVEKDLYESDEIISKISEEDMILDNQFSKHLFALEVLINVWKQQAVEEGYEEDNILDYIVNNHAEEFNKFVKTVQEMKTLFDKYQHGSEICKQFKE